MKKLLLGTAIAAAALSSQSYAELSATAGFVSDYYFRGENLGDAGAYGSIDYASGGFYAGAWAIDDVNSDSDTPGANDGLEYDIYFGYGQESDSFSWNIGYARYEYTYGTGFEHEVDLTLGFNAFTFDIIKGQADPNEDGTDADDYTVLTVNYAPNAFGITLGYKELDDVEDSDIMWVEASFGGELVEGIEASINIGMKSDDEAAGTQDDGYMYLDFSKNFDL